MSIQHFCRVIPALVYWWFRQGERTLRAIPQMSWLSLLGSGVIVGVFGAWWRRLPVVPTAIATRRDERVSPLELVLPHLRGPLRSQE